MENFTNKQINFDILKERAHNLRWAEVPDGVIPLTAADHDFPCAPEVVEALTDYIKDGYFPYIENRGMERFKEDLAKSFRERKNEPVEAKYVLPIDSVARGMQVIADSCSRGMSALCLTPWISCSVPRCRTPVQPSNCSPRI